MKAKFLVPLALFLLLAGFLAYGLKLNPREVPSPLVDKPAPAFRVAQLQSPEASFALEDMRGKVWLLNVWASWCVSCRAEHPVLLELKQRGVVPVVGLNYKDTVPDALGYLAQHGNPFATIGVDPQGAVGFEYGVYGTPETFLIDANGVIRYKHIGPLTRDTLDKVLLPKIAELSRAG
ncbi:DsbE family thiol:disulfide interchange protein [Pseudothauera rhizosphaerae]|uniref:DsbE family thiol:disulfide interchange protein n=1 Tax=Pseudothauera rhizosphaerae TaxID=2565932 RepID=A0A4S4APD1_9RHOO|nr:DsbE family thiol:disulfide interchange protein [Pseudothauera rhizosphaerae]THF60300.1 DsbE family thiol:disulfide interchange protein [Pseudothauera rhizosphaerae]